MKSGNVQVWESKTSRPTTDKLQHSAFVSSVSFSEDEGQIFCRDSYQTDAGQVRGTVRSWKIHPTRAAFGLKLPGRATHARFGPANRWIAVGLRTNGVCLIDRRSGEIFGPVGTPETFLHLDFSPDGSQLAATSNKELVVWDMETFLKQDPPRFRAGLRSNAKPIARISANVRFSRVRFSPDNEYMATVWMGRTVRLWNAKTGEPVTPPLIHDRWVHDVRFRPNGSQLLTTTEDATRLWSWDSLPGRPEVIKISRGASRWTSQYSADGSEILGTTITEAVVWNPNDGKRVFTIPHRRSIRDSALSPDGTRILTALPHPKTIGRVPGTVYLWNRHTGERLAEMSTTAQTSSTKFSPDSSCVIASYGDSKLRVWDAETGKPMTVFLPHPVANSRLFEVSADGRAILSLCGPTLRLFPMPYQSPAPDWLPDLAEAIAGLRINEKGHTELIHNISEVRARLADIPNTGEYGRFAQWFLSDSRHRGPCPEHLTVPMYRDDP